LFLLLLSMTFNLQNLIRSSVGAAKYSLSGLKQNYSRDILRCVSNSIWPDERTN